MTDAVLELYLASASPRRRELLNQLGVRFAQLAVAVDEAPLADEAPAAYVARLALAKARAGQQLLGGCALHPVLGADTTVVVDGMLLGKPRDREHGLAILAQLSGREHEVFSAVALVRGERERLRVQVSRVRFRALSARERAAYWASGEPADKAGSYGVQGLGAVFIQELHGSHSSVMGLPLYETGELLGEFGIDIFSKFSNKMTGA
jgi:septum formation protein